MSKIVVIICGIELTIINTLRNSSSNILSAYWIVQTIGKHIVAQDTLAGGDESVGVDKSAEVGIIITALEVIELGFGDTLLATTYKMPCEIASCTHTISIQQGCGNATIYSSKHEKSFGYTNNLH